MKRLLYISMILLCGIATNARTWTNVRNRKVDAEIVSISAEKETVTLESRSGRQQILPFDQFSDADRDYLENYARYLTTPPVVLDCSQIPELDPWSKKAGRVIEEWYPRMAELLYSEGCKPPSDIRVTINNPGQGVAATAGNHIGVAASWIAKEPGHGVLIHELVHVVQAYRGGGVGWLTEGIADYIRWGLYEEKPLEWFSVPREGQGYRQGYQAAAGFLLWLENSRAPGIVKKLNAASREKRYADDLFKTEIGTGLDELWAEYKKARENKK